MNDLTRKEKRKEAKLQICARCVYFTAMLPFLNGYHLDSICYQYRAKLQQVIILPNEINP